MEEIPLCPICGSDSCHDLIRTSAHMHSSTEMFSFSCCDACAAAFLYPRLEIEHLQNYYPSTYLPYRGAKAWGKYERLVAHNQRRMDTKRANRCFTYRAPDVPVALLDVGCGHPTFLETLSTRTTWSLTGIDLSSAGWGGGPPSHITLLKGNMQSIKFERRFDLVTMWHYLEHDYEPCKTIRAVRKIMPKGGKLIIEIPDYLSLPAWWQDAYWEGWHAPRHVVLYSQLALSILLQKHGFRMIDYYRYGTLSASLLWWMGVMEKKGIDWNLSMEHEFLPFLWRMLYSAPLFLFEKVIPLGIQTAVAEAI